MCLWRACASVEYSTQTNAYEHFYQESLLSCYVLCKLHNYCISNRDAIYSHIESDSSYVVMVGGLFLPRMKNHREAFWEYDLSGADRLCALLDSREHTDDHTPNERHNQARKYSDKDLPCNVILQHAREETGSDPNIIVCDWAESN